MKKQTTKILATGAAGVFLTSLSAQAAVWTGLGVDNEFSTAANWDDNLAPAGGSTQDINTAVTVERNLDSTAGRTFISNGGVMNISAGTQSDNTSGAGTRNFLGRGSDGTINQSGGSYDIGHMLSIGGGGASGNGIYNLTGGSLTVSRGANSIIDGNNPLGRPSLEVSDEENAGSGLFEISGGSLLTRFGAQIGQTGTFHVLGSGATSIGIGNNNNGTGWWSQEASSTLQMTIDSGGVTSIFVDEVGDGVAVAVFKSGSILDLGFSVAPSAGTWTILELENQDIDDQGLGLAAGDSAAGWSFDVDNSGTNGVLTATYVPEPSIALLGGLGLLGLLRRRRN